MEEKNYQQFEEKENTGIASEPSVAVQNVGVGSYTGAVTIHDEIDDLDWGRCPILGPKTLEEAVARIEKAESEIDDPTKWTASEQMWDEMHQKFPWLQ
jgi:hypothetical protein